MADDIRTQAATYIDGEHRRVHDDLIHEHRRQEQRMLSWEKSRLESHARNREVSGLRYAQRLRTIGEKRDRINPSRSTAYQTTPDRAKRVRLKPLQKTPGGAIHGPMKPRTWGMSG